VFSEDGWKMAIPGFLYVLQDALQYVAISNLDAATVQVLCQLKILTTAVFSIMLLNRTFSIRKWLSLFLLMVGIVLIQIPLASHNSAITMEDLRRNRNSRMMSRSIRNDTIDHIQSWTSLIRRSASYEGMNQASKGGEFEINVTIGVLATVTMAIISGFAGVFFEKVLKNSRRPVSLSVRNLQLAFYSLFPALSLLMLPNDARQISTHGFFAGYNWLVLFVIVLQASGGILVSFVISFTNNIAKNFATSISILLSFLFSVIFSDFHISWIVRSLLSLHAFSDSLTLYSSF